jgi:hypothetical protein
MRVRLQPYCIVGQNIENELKFKHMLKLSSASTKWSGSLRLRLRNTDCNYNKVKTQRLFHNFLCEKFSKKIFREQTTKFRENRDIFRKSFRFRERLKKCFRPNSKSQYSESQHSAIEIKSGQCEDFAVWHRISNQYGKFWKIFFYIEQCEKKIMFSLKLKLSFPQSISHCFCKTNGRILFKINTKSFPEI